MASEKKVDEAPHTVVQHSYVQDIRQCVVSVRNNKSRWGSTKVLDVLGTTKGKVPLVCDESIEILDNIQKDGFKDTIAALVTTPVLASDVESLRLESAAHAVEMQTLPMFSGSGPWKRSYKGVNFEIGMEDYHAEWMSTFPLKVKDDDGNEQFRITEDSKLLQAGNRRTILKVLGNAEKRKAGFPEDVCYSIRCAEFSYRTVKDRENHNIQLNEMDKLGKLEASPRQVLGNCFDKVDEGMSESEILNLYGNIRGRCQASVSQVLLVRIISWFFEELFLYKGKKVVGAELAKLIRTECLDGTIPIFKQGLRLTASRGLRAMVEHSDGHTPEFRKARSYVTDKGVTKNVKPFGYDPRTQLHGVAAFKEQALAHPKIVQEIVTWIEGVQTKGFQDPYFSKNGKPTTVSSLASTDIQAVAAQCPPEFEKALNTLAGVDTGLTLKGAVQSVLDKHEEELQKLRDQIEARSIRLYNEEDKPDGDPISQEQFRPIWEQALANKPKAKRRRRAK